MRSSKIKMFRFLLLTFLTFTFFNCSSNKEVNSNKDFVLKTNKKSRNLENTNILYIVDGNEVDSKFVETIKSYKIESITVLKGKKEVAKYSKKEYEGVILIKMK